MTAVQKGKGDPEIRRRILETAAELFHSHGYNAIGMNEFIEKAGVAKRTFYKYFDSKAAVLKAYLEAFDDRFFQLAAEEIEAIPDPKKRIPALFDVRTRIQQYNRFLGCPFVKIHAEIGFDNPEVAGIVRESKTRLKTYIRKLVAAANDKRLLSNEEMTEMIFLLMDGALLAVSIFKSADDLKKAKALVGRFL